MSARLWTGMLSSLVLLGCSRGEGDDKVVPESESDAGTIVVDAAAADAGMPGEFDASVASASCEGQDALSALICQFGQGAGADGGAGGQVDLQGILDSLGGLTGILGTSGAGTGLGMVTAPTDQQCASPADQVTQILCGLRRDGGIPRGGGRFGRGDASVPPPIDREDAGLLEDAGAPDFTDAGVLSPEDAGAESAEGTAADAEPAPPAT